MESDDLHLIDQIYEAVHNPVALLPAYKALALRCGGFVAHSLTVDPRKKSVLESQVSDAALEYATLAYAQYYVSVDTRVPWYLAGQIGEWRADQCRYDDLYVQRSEIYNDFLKPVGVKRMVVLHLRGTDNMQVLSIGRAYDAGGFGEHDLQRLRLFSPHLVRAAELRARLWQLESACDAAQGALEHLPYITLWVDGSGRIAWLSPGAQARLAGADGLSIRANRLHCTEARAAPVLQAAMARATRPGQREGRCLAIPRTHQPSPWIVSVIPGQLPSEHGPGHTPHALVIVQDGASASMPATHQLQALYGLTPAEARLAIGLLQRDTLALYAERHRISLATVKTHLRNLFDKTGTHRQADLLHLLSLPLPARRLIRMDEAAVRVVGIGCCTSASSGPEVSKRDRAQGRFVDIL